jgi:hypothetical protein
MAELTVCVRTAKSSPQWLKPGLICDEYGTTEVVPSRVAGIVTQTPKLRPPTRWQRKAVSTEGKSCTAERTDVLRQNP